MGAFGRDEMAPGAPQEQHRTWSVIRVRSTTSAVRRQNGMPAVVGSSARR